MTSPKLAVCLRVQQKSVWCLSSQSVCIVLVHIFVPLCPTRSRFHSKLVSTASRSVSISLFGEWRRGEEQQWRGLWRGVWGEKESSAVFTVWSLRGILLPRPAPALPPLTSGQCSGVRESRSGGGGLCRRRGGGWLCRSPVFSSQGQGLPLLPLLFRTSREEMESIVRKIKNKGPLLRRLCGGTALGRAGGQTGAAAAWGGAAGPAARGPAFQAF